ncbi:MAG: XRE family transcriptional regulator [Sodalis sp. (in: enterobacteria)]|uniref:XRE family transcriptional regulator n=1 Tax=Sodalis sp. (in: enterobacteria) TaxID=1898979 RepID=UPI0039E3D514
MKETTFADRLNLAMKEGGYTQASLGEAVGMAQPSVWKLTSGKSNSTRKLIEISRVLNVRPEWLATGRGVMRETDLKPHDPNSTIPPENEWGRIEPLDRHTPLRSDEVEIPFLKDIEFACGDGCIQEEDYNGFKLRFSEATLKRVGANSDGTGVICFPASGDSMEPIIPDGSTIAIDTNNKRIIDGRLYAIAQEGCDNDKLKRIKQLYRKPGGKLIIHSFNREEDEEAQESDVEIIGRVFWYSVLL